MAKNKIAVAALLLIGAALNAQENRLHTVFEMNSSPAVINSHAGEEQWSRLQPIHSHTQLVKHDFLVGSLPDFNPVFPAFSALPCSHPFPVFFWKRQLPDFSGDCIKIYGVLL